MQIQQQVSRTIGTKEYIKSWVVIPPDFMKELNLKKGDILDKKIEGNKIIIEKKETISNGKK